MPPELMDPDGGNLIPQAGHRQWDRLSFWLVVGQMTGDRKYLGRMNGAIRLATLWWFCDKFVVTGWRNITVCSDSFSHADSIGVSILTFRAHRFICSQQYIIHCLELKNACAIFRPLRSLVADDFLKHYGYSLYMAIPYIIYRYILCMCIIYIYFISYIYILYYIIFYIYI